MLESGVTVLYIICKYVQKRAIAKRSIVRNITDKFMLESRVTVIYNL